MLITFTSTLLGIAQAGYLFWIKDWWCSVDVSVFH